MSSNNQAAWIDGKAAQLRVAEAPMPKAEAGQIVIRNKAIAINPVDWKIQDYGLFIQQWPAVLGEDVAGEVVEVGEGVSSFKKGDRVTSHTLSLVTSKPEDGGFQLYSRAAAAKTAKIPDSMSFAQGSVIPLALDTAAVGLYSDQSSGYLGLPMPSFNPSSSGKTIVVWGGSSSVGSMVIQLAAASGAKVVATASQQNHEFCKSLGASEVIDYKNASVVDDVVAAVKKVGGTFVGVYDAISEQDKSYKHTVPIIEKLGGGSLPVVLGGPENPPSSVKVGQVFGVNDMTHPIWADYLPKGLESGKFRAVPEPLVIGKGLENVQKGMDKNKEGVSAKKVVIEV
ncbi:uncharacterized protein LTR77_007884 [Saxophila tyrrhenica]|uniref:Enoyl reductase (ER) domain-containing protein n=1 Tax=Saxophila tyrrhenica TaxID=1690608 RepID=A0AAV9P5B1_9PEZI|nr:hypothetical protein LTR77_007884 [Saxophila tyrrhenica]